MAGLVPRGSLILLLIVGLLLATVPAAPHARRHDATVASRSLRDAAAAVGPADLPRLAPGAAHAIRQAFKSHCCDLSMACIDQGVIILHGPEDNPIHGGKVPYCAPNDDATPIGNDLFGVPDVWGTQWVTPRWLIRPTAGPEGEESDDVARPSFSNATHPIIVYAAYIRVFGEFLRRTVASAYAFQRAGLLPRAPPARGHAFPSGTPRASSEAGGNGSTSEPTFLLAADSMRLERPHWEMLAPFARLPPATLAHASSRLPAATPENYTAEGAHVRCFERLTLCSHPYPITPRFEGKYTAVGQALLNHYQAQLPPLPPVMRSPGVLRVMLATRKRTGIRNILNRDEVLAWCRQYKPPADAPVQPGSVHCFMHSPGKSFAADMALASHTDVMVGLHGSGLNHYIFMQPGSSLVEVRPYEFGRSSWSENFFPADLAGDMHRVHWYGVNVENVTNSQPGALEKQRKGEPYVWMRDRNVRIEPRALQYIFDRILMAGRDREKYMQYVHSGEHFITDELEKVPADPDKRGPKAKRQGAAAGQQQGKA